MPENDRPFLAIRRGHNPGRIDSQGNQEILCRRRTALAEPHEVVSGIRARTSAEVCIGAAVQAIEELLIGQRAEARRTDTAATLLCTGTTTVPT